VHGRRRGAALAPRGTGVSVAAGVGTGAGGPPQQLRSLPARRRPSSSRRTRHRLIALAALLVSAAPRVAAQQHASSVVAPFRWLGCYELAAGPWSVPVDSSFAPPPVLRLDSLPALAPPTGRGRWFAVQGAVPPFAARRPLFAVVGWRPSSGDSATVVWGDGFARLTATVALRGDSIAGTLLWRRVTARLDSAGRPLRDPVARASLAGARAACE